MKTCGIDVSTYTGMAWADGEEGLGKLVHFPESKGFERLHLIAQEVRRTLEIWKPDLVLIEAYAHVHKGSIATVISCGTVVRMEVHRLGLRWLEITPSVLKKWTTGNGAAKKPQMAASAQSRWGYRSPSDDIVDAYCLARMGQVGVSQLEVLKGVSHGR